VVTVQRSSHLGPRRRASSSIVDFLLGERPTATSVHPPLCPLRGVEVFLIPNIVWELLSPLLHQELVMLGDDDSALRLAVAVTVLIGDEARREREELHLRTSPLGS
jgi:hypothetical protein